MHHRLYWCICIIVSFTVFQQAYCVTSAEINALQEFYVSTNGANSWDTRRTWDFSGSPNPCSGTWRGITCTGSSVSGIQLQFLSSQMQGRLPGSLGDLSELTSLLVLFDEFVFVACYLLIMWKVLCWAIDWVEHCLLSLELGPRFKPCEYPSLLVNWKSS